MKFRSRQLVDAVQIREDNVHQVLEVMKIPVEHAGRFLADLENGKIVTPTPNGEVQVRMGDYLVLLGNGAFAHANKEQFELQYELVW